MYVTGMGSYAASRKWRSICERIEDDGDVDAEMETALHEIIQSEKCQFQGFVIKEVANIGNNGKRQLFFSTLMARYHGLSRYGSNVLAKFGFAMPKTLYDDMTAIPDWNDDQAGVEEIAQAAVCGPLFDGHVKRQQGTEKHDGYIE